MMAPFRGVCCAPAITVWIWVLISWLMDVRHLHGWGAERVPSSASPKERMYVQKGWALVAPAGQNPLLAYILSELLAVAGSTCFRTR